MMAPRSPVADKGASATKQLEHAVDNPQWVHEQEVQNNRRHHELLAALRGGQSNVPRSVGKKSMEVPKGHPDVVDEILRGMHSG